MIFGNPVLGPRIVPKGQPRLATDKLPNGRPAFRVTQLATDPDAWYMSTHIGSDPTRAPRHGGLDLGNYNHGDAVIAAGPGTATRHTDSSGANFVRVIHPGGWLTEYWHLESFTIAAGSVIVAEGTELGRVGHTGFSLNAADHVHWTVKQLVNGVWVIRDGWPLLKQNQPEDTVTTIYADPIPLTGWQTKVGDLYGYKVGVAPKKTTWTKPSGASCDAIVSKVEPLPAGWPVGPFLRVTNGSYAGYLVPQASVTFTAPDPCAAQLAATQDALLKAQADLAIANNRISGAKNALGA